MLTINGVQQKVGDGGGKANEREIDFKASKKQAGLGQDWRGV